MPAGTTYDGSTRLYWFPIADKPLDLDSIGQSELDDAIDVSGYVVPDSLALNFSNSRVEGRDLLTAFDNQSIGRYQAAPVIDFKRKLADDGAELAWTTFRARKTKGVFVYFETLEDEEEPGVGDDYIALVCETGAPMPRNTAINAEVRFGVEVGVLSAPVYGTIASS